MARGEELVPTVADPQRSLGEGKAVPMRDHDGTGPGLTLSGRGGDVCRGGG
ncbi:hypothetical protein YC2023_076263 [Brassica napus]